MAEWYDRPDPTSRRASDDLSSLCSNSQLGGLRWLLLSLRTASPRDRRSERCFFSLRTVCIVFGPTSAHQRAVTDRPQTRASSRFACPGPPSRIPQPRSSVCRRLSVEETRFGRSCRSFHLSSACCCQIVSRQRPAVNRTSLAGCRRESEGPLEVEIAEQAADAGIRLSYCGLSRRL